MTTLKSARVVALAVLVSGAACTCRNEVREVIPSPDGRLQAVSYSRDCGATTSESLHVSILDKGRLPGDETSNVIAADAGHDPTVSLNVKISWEAPARLIVEVDPALRYFAKNQRAAGVEIVYRPIGRKTQ